MDFDFREVAKAIFCIVSTSLLAITIQLALHRLFDR